MPLLVLWGDHNAVNKGVDIVAIWRERALDVRGHGVPSGHWMPEEVPAQLIKEVSAFIDENDWQFQDLQKNHRLKEGPKS